MKITRKTINPERLQPVRDWLSSQFVNAGNAFRLFRDRSGLNQGEVAERLGVAQSAVSKWERGRALPETKTLIDLAVLYGCRLDDLLAGVNVQYDHLRRDLLRQSGMDDGTSNVSSSGGPVDVPATARVLAEVTKAYSKFVSQVSNAARQLTDLADGQADLVRHGPPTAARSAKRRRR